MNRLSISQSLSQTPTSLVTVHGLHPQLGLPRVNIPPPPFKEGMGPFPQPLAYHLLRFRPLGLFDLQRRLGVFVHEPDLWTAYEDRFLASDIGWFSGGLSTDGSHYPRGGGFFPEFLAMRASLPLGPLGSSARRALNKRVRHAIFDLATLWDRSFGGTTMVLHVDGTTVPGAPTEPEYLVANTYLPPAFIDSHLGSHAAIARIAQLFLEAVGRRMGDLQQVLANQHIPPTSTSSSVSTLSASAASSSSSFPASMPISTPLSTSAPANGDEDYEVGDDFESVSADMLDALERAAYAESRVNEAQSQIEQLEEQIAILMTRVEASDALSANLQAQLSARRTAHSFTPPSTPSRSQARPAVRTPLSRPTHARSPIPGPSSNLRSPLAAGTNPDHTNALDLCITELELDSLAVSIRLVICALPPAKWYEELLQFNIASSSISQLIDAAS
ncbi:hypothetical protein C8R45DRAFT_936524 [Mycena sanguinolenta]|nr:hypothetical protein C8R45DRAFT_936524 [Mycena sanguinolenta]